MYAWISERFGEQIATFVTYGLGALAVLIVMWMLWFWTRRVRGGVFIAGSRGRKPRLAVVDAAAVDSHRRIVLIRRDDVEHLVMIGGHNDIVIERGIGIRAATGEPASRRVADDEQSPTRGQTKMTLVPENQRAEAPRPASSARQPRDRQEPVLHSATSRPTAVDATSAVQRVSPALADELSLGARQVGDRSDVITGPRAEEPVRATTGERVDFPTPDMRSTAPAAEGKNARPNDEASLENEMEKLLAELSDDK